MILGRDLMKHLLLALVTIAAVVGFQVACDKVPLTSPTGSSISLATNTNIVPVNGFAEITATVIESAGTAVHNGTEVTFLSDFGRLDPATAQTSGGRAVTRFYPDGRSGTARVNAFSGAASTGTGGNSSSGGITLLVGGAAAGRLTLRADPPTVPQTGGSVQLFAHVSDTNGNALHGAPVSFSTNASASGAGSISPPSVTTDANGNAQTTLTTRQTVTVLAVVDAATGANTSASLTVGVLSAPNVTLNCPTTTQSVGAPVSCTIASSSPGGAPIINVTINWGDGSGEQPVSQTSGTAGVSHRYSSPGAYTVVASATDLNSQRGTATAAVVVTRAAAPTITFTQTSGTTPAASMGGPPESFSVSATTTTGLTITSIVVKRSNGETLYNQSGGGSFAALVAAGDILTATATDSAGNTSISQLVVQ